jgi:ATP-dependent RNA helicase DDX35
LDAAAFFDYFSAGERPDEVTIVSLEGRMYPVDIAYLKETAADYVQKAAQVAYAIHRRVCCLSQCLDQSGFYKF